MEFSVDQEHCIGCEACVSDCPLLVLTMKREVPTVASGREALCINCLHCLTICPTGAISINGYGPNDCLPLENMLPNPEKMEVLIRGRRSVRKYIDEDVNPELMEKLLQVAWQAPTGVNARSVLFTVVDNRKTMNKLRDALMKRLAELVEAGKLPENLNFFAGFVKLWEEKGIDTLFRGAPHMIITSAPRSCPCPDQDCVIALSYFELFAYSLGIGCVWDGLAKWAFNELMPEFKKEMGIPEDHAFGYVMAFGNPAIEYHRSVPLRPASINRLSF